MIGSIGTGSLVVPYSHGSSSYIWLRTGMAILELGMLCSGLLLGSACSPSLPPTQWNLYHEPRNVPDGHTTSVAPSLRR